VSFHCKRCSLLNIHDLNKNLNYLSSNVLSLYCVFDVRNLVLCLTRELIKFIDYSKVDSFSILMIFLPTKAELNVVLHCNFRIIL
jgi:hypothetical protein